MLEHILSIERGEPEEIRARQLNQVNFQKVLFNYGILRRRSPTI
jgi:hypothetical protein